MLPPLRVTLLPPSMTSFGAVLLKTFAVDVSVIVTGSGPQSNVMTPPFATAATNASPVHVAGVPLPTTVVGCETSSASPAAGTVSMPSGLPAGGPSSGFVAGTGVVAPSELTSPGGAPSFGPPSEPLSPTPPSDREPSSKAPSTPPSDRPASCAWSSPQPELAPAKIASDAPTASRATGPLARSDAWNRSMLRA
jgi:hypothetical protein